MQQQLRQELPEEEQPSLLQYLGFVSLQNYLYGNHLQNSPTRQQFDHALNTSSAQHSSSLSTRRCLVVQKMDSLFQCLQGEIQQEKLKPASGQTIAITKKEGCSINTDEEWTHFNELPDSTTIYTYLRLYFCLIPWKQFATLHGKKAKQSQKHSVQEADRKKQDIFGYYKVVDKIEPDWMKIKYEAMAVKDHLLWPCLTLQPLETSCQSHTSKEMTFHVSDDCFQDLPIRSEQLNREGALTQQDKLQLEQRIVKKINDKNVQTIAEEKILIYLVGTRKLVLTSTLIPWLTFDSRQLNYLLNKTALGLTPPNISSLIVQLNPIILYLNALKQQQQVLSVQGNCLGRLCQYEQQDSSISPCLALLKDIQKKNHRIFIRILNREEQRYLWVEQCKLRINLTVPPFNTNLEQYQLVACTYNVMATIYYIQKRLKASQNENRIKQADQENICGWCQKEVSRYQPNKNCRFCLHNNFLHAISSSEEWLADSDSQVEKKQNKPCRICTLIEKNWSFSCTQCSKPHHILCASLSTLQTKQPLPTKSTFICHHCFTCFFCKKQLKSPNFYRTNGKPACFFCFVELADTRPCGICKKIERESKSVNCIVETCRKVVHYKCDPLIQQLIKEEGEQVNLQDYVCGKCRLLRRRTILKWLIEDIRTYDDNQYYMDPSYEALVDYLRIIKHPICLQVMRCKVSEGLYDSNPYESILNDLRLLVSNALCYNMPNDDPYYRAKILYILASGLLNAVKNVLQWSQLQVMRGDIRQEYYNKVKAYIRYVNSNYLNVLLNHDSESAVVEANSNLPQSVLDNIIYSSKDLLDVHYKNVNKLQHRLKKNSVKIDVLLSRQKTSTMIPQYGTIKQEICVNHPRDRYPIVFRCQICWQSYCCTYSCHRHMNCSLCRKQPCSCGSIVRTCPCGQPSSNEGLRKTMRQKASQLNLTTLQLTEYYRYCFKCAYKNVKGKMKCFVCQKFAYYGYKRCKECEKVFHLDCVNKGKVDVPVKRSQDKGIKKQSKQDKQYCPSCQAPIKNIIRKTSLPAKNVGYLATYYSLIALIYASSSITFNDTDDLTKLLQQNYLIINSMDKYLRELRQQQMAVRQMLDKSAKDQQNFILKSIPVKQLNFEEEDEKQEEKQNKINEDNVDEQQSQHSQNSLHNFQDDNNPLKRSLEYVRGVLLKLYNYSRPILRLGNTFFITSTETCHHVLKVHHREPHNFIIHRNKEKQWLYTIDDRIKEVSTLKDVIEHTKDMISGIKTEQQIVDFLGLNVDITEAWKRKSQKGKNVNSLLVELMDLSRKERKEKVQQHFKDLTSQYQQLSTSPAYKQSSDTIKIPFLSKRIQVTSVKPPEFPRIIISFDQLKREAGFGVIRPNWWQDLPLTQPLPDQDLYIGTSKIDRIGLFTHRFIPKHTLVIEYIGEVIGEQIADLREAQYKDGCYMFSFDKGVQARRADIIDATRMGNRARYINHSCDANCMAKTITKNDGESGIFIFTLRDVKAHEELTYDYQFKKDSAEYLECRCKSKNCQKRLN